MIDKVLIANRSDAEAIAQLVNTAYRPAPDSAGWTHETGLVAGDRITTGQVEAIMAMPDSCILAGFSNSGIVACVHIERDGKNSYIGMLSVHPLVQGSGVGKQMLAHAEDHAHKVFGSEKFTMVVVSARTELISFYLRRGYERTGVIMDYPLSAGAGTPLQANLKIERLEKQAMSCA